MNSGAIAIVDSVEDKLSEELQELEMHIFVHTQTMYSMGFILLYQM